MFDRVGGGRAGYSVSLFHDLASSNPQYCVDSAGYAKHQRNRFVQRRTLNDGSVRRYLYDATQQLTQVRSGSDTGAILAGYGYDNAGNQTQRSGTATLTLAYDALDRLGSAGGAGIATETYRYDHQGRRIETVTGGTPKRFVYAGQNLLSEYGADWSAAQTHSAYAGLDHPLLRNTPSGNAYYHADGLGSLVATSNAAGQITASARYDAFGQTLAKTGTIPRYGYAGREPDQTGLIYYRARYNDPALGRFCQRDPAGFADGINPNAYVGNNPISFSDPLGLMKQSPTIWGTSAYVGNTAASLLLGVDVTARDRFDEIPGGGGYKPIGLQSSASPIDAVASVAAAGSVRLTNSVRSGVANRAEDILVSA